MIYLDNKKVMQQISTRSRKSKTFATKSSTIFSHIKEIIENMQINIDINLESITIKKIKVLRCPQENFYWKYANEIKGSM